MSRLPSGTVAGNAAPWAERAVAAHALYVPEVRHPVEVDVTGASPDQNLAQEQHLARWLTKRLALPVKLFDLRAQGFELIGGRLLPDASGPGAQLMYQAIAAPATTAASASARLANAAPPLRVTVYLRRPDAAAPAAFRFEQEGRLGMFLLGRRRGRARRSDRLCAGRRTAARTPAGARRGDLRAGPAAALIGLFAHGRRRGTRP